MADISQLGESLDQKHTKSFPAKAGPTERTRCCWWHWLFPAGAGPADRTRCCWWDWFFPAGAGPTDRTRCC
jgi:hypothetical protein